MSTGLEPDHPDLTTIEGHPLEEVPRGTGLCLPRSLDWGLCEGLRSEESQGLVCPQQDEQDLEVQHVQKDEGQTLPDDS